MNINECKSSSGEVNHWASSDDQSVSEFVKAFIQENRRKRNAGVIPIVKNIFDRNFGSSLSCFFNDAPNFPVSPKKQKKIIC